MNLVLDGRDLKTNIVGWRDIKIRDPRIIISEQTVSLVIFSFAFNGGMLLTYSDSKEGYDELLASLYVGRNDQKAECFLANVKFS